MVKRKPNAGRSIEGKASYKNLFISGLLIAIVLGVFIPSSIISSSPEEFISITYFHNPINYIIHTFALSFGFFVVWVGVFYWISNETFKTIFEKLLSVIAIVFIVNYMFFGNNLGNLLPNLSYEETFAFSKFEIILNLLVIIFVLLISLFLNKKFKKSVLSFLCVVILAISVISGLNVNTIVHTVNEYSKNIEEIRNNKPYFNLSKEGKNVIVLMLDRAMNSHVPYIFNEKPELKEKFEGFTYYNNVVSLGGSTVFGASSVFGGYEYTPVELNKRDTELLVTKHNEALKVLPHLYDENDYDVTVCDPVYANYRWIPDLSIYDEYSDINTFITEGIFSTKNMDLVNINNNYRNFFCFSLMKCMPVITQKTIYNMGNYHKLALTNMTEESVEDYSTQNYVSPTKSSGISYNFMKSYNTLINLNSMTKIKEDQSNNFLMMANNMTHEPMMLQTPDYVPSMNVDNTEYYQANKDKYIISGHKLELDTKEEVIHYHVNMTAFIQLGKWFDYMRENGVYDNTKIILVSDHGRDCDQIEALNIQSNDFSIERYYPLLMVKDFNSTTFTTSNEFMTNADVPTLAVKDTIENPINPFTGKEITNISKSNPQYVTMSNYWNTSDNNSNTFKPSKWAIVKDDIWNHDNWSFIDEEVVNPQQ